MLKKGISTIIATILLVIITISLVGTVYIFFSGLLHSLIQGVKIGSISCKADGNINIIIRNIGTDPITHLTVDQIEPADDEANDWEGILEAGEITVYTDVCLGQALRRCTYLIIPNSGRGTKAGVTCLSRSDISNGEICENAENAGLCDGLDILYGEGYKDACCSEHGFCC
jgi:flagellin-like protein